MSHFRSDRSRARVAREAALLLYTSQEKEYKQAKMRAAQMLGVRVYPSNREVAEELDKIAEEIEGKSRSERLKMMREEALKVMETLKDFNPLLIGSVWRGTAHKNSDIDIEVFAEDSREVAERLRLNGYRILREEWKSTVKKGEKKVSLHIYVKTKNDFEVEVTVRSTESIGERRICEIYGDEIIGLNRRKLKEVLEKDPLKKFLPK